MEEDAVEWGPGVVIGILGPTGVGKTAVAVESARMLSTPVVSCDSMQVYRGFPVLTNQPTEAERRAVRHELVDFVEPDRVFSAAEYSGLARPLLRAHLRERGWALVVGGTGLYMRAALGELAMPGQGDPELRKSLEAKAGADGPQALHAELAALDPDAAAAIDYRNVRRVIRALETVTVSGSGWSGRDDLWEPVYDACTLVVGLVGERTRVYERIDHRAEAIVTGGAVEEVRRFRESADGRSTEPGGPGICSAIGYPEICRYLDGAQGLAETVGQVAAATRRYARRQLTWLSKVRDAVIIDPRDRHPREVAEQIIHLALSGEGVREP